jgi:hypothetical protein
LTCDVFNVRFFFCFVVDPEGVYGLWLGGSPGIWSSSGKMSKAKPGPILDLCEEPLVRVVLSLRGSAGVFLFVARLNSNCSFTVALCGRGAMLAVGVFVLRRAIFGVVR